MEAEEVGFAKSMGAWTRSLRNVCIRSIVVSMFLSANSWIDSRKPRTRVTSQKI